MRRSLMIAIAVVVLLPSLAQAALPVAVKTGKRSTFAASANAGYLAWSQDVAGSKGLRVMVQPAGGTAFEVTSSGFAESGQMDHVGSTLPYYRFTHGSGEIKLYDMATKTQLPVPPGVDTSHSEYFPAVYDSQMTFIRQSRSAITLYLVTDLTTGAKIIVKQLDPSRAIFANAPSLTANWVTYATCSRAGCSAFRYQITSTTTVKIPNPDAKFYFAPSPDIAGNVYFEQSGARCGSHAKLMKWTGSGNPTAFYALADRRDLNGTSVFDDGAGTVVVYADFLNCVSFDQNIYKFTSP